MARSKHERAKRVAHLIRDGINKPQGIIARIDKEPEFAYNHSTFNLDASLKSLQRDIKRLRRMGHVFIYDRKRGCYVEDQASATVFTSPLTDDELAVLAQLRDTHRFTPYSDAAQSLHDKVARLLPETQRAKLLKRPPIRMSIPMLDELSQHLATAQQVLRAFDEQRELEFHYRMPGRNESYPMRVQVLGPLELIDGHAYFDAYSLKSDVERTYRLDRVVPGSARVLPAKRPPRARRSHLLPIKYWLASNVEPTKHFPLDFSVQVGEGGATVNAKIEERNLFRAAKILLKYGQNCIVIEPPELVDEVRRAVEEMAKHYGLLE